MKNYIDEFSQYHTDFVSEVDPLPTNDGFIHTAYAQKVGLPINKEKLENLFSQCLKNDKLYQRLPNKPTPPPSRDVVLGATALGLLKPQHLNGWNFSPFPLLKFSLVKLIKQLWECKDQHRNYFWKNNLDQIYRFAFSVPIQDRHFILKHWNKFQWYNPAHLLYAAIAKVDSLLPKKSGIKWLKHGGRENLKAMVKEFPADHDITVKVGL